MIHANVPLVYKNIHIWFVKPISFATPFGVTTHSFRSPGMNNVHGCAPLAKIRAALKKNGETFAMFRFGKMRWHFFVLHLAVEEIPLHFASEEPALEIKLLKRFSAPTPFSPASNRPASRGATEQMPLSRECQLVLQPCTCPCFQSDSSFLAVHSKAGA